MGFWWQAFLLGAYVIWQAGLDSFGDWRCGRRVCGGVSGGKTPVSYLPGERSHGVMGGLIPLACYQALTGDLNWLMLLWGGARDYWRGPDHDDEQHVRH